MKREEFLSVQEHSEAIRNDAMFAIEEVAAQHKISNEQAAALFMVAVADMFFPEHVAPNSVPVRFDLYPGSKGLVQRILPANETEKCVTQGEDFLRIDVSGIGIPYESAVEYIILSGDRPKE